MMMKKRGIPWKEKKDEKNPQVKIFISHMKSFIVSEPYSGTGKEFFRVYNTINDVLLVAKFWTHNTTLSNPS